MMDAKRKVTKKRIAPLISLILVFSLVLGMTPTVLAQDTMSYEEYFSEAREWSYNYSGMVTEDLSQIIYVGSCSDHFFGHPPEGMYLLNRLYLENMETGEFTLLLDENVESLANVNGKLICIINGNKIVLVDLSGNITYTYYEAAKGEKLSNIYGNSELIFFRKNDTICRIHIASGRMDELLTQPGIIYYEPKTSVEFYWTIATPEWIAIHGNHVCGTNCDNNDMVGSKAYIYYEKYDLSVERIYASFGDVGNIGREIYDLPEEETRVSQGVEVADDIDALVSGNYKDVLIYEEGAALHDLLQEINKKSGIYVHIALVDGIDSDIEIYAKATYEIYEKNLDNRLILIYDHKANKLGMEYGKTVEERVSEEVFTAFSEKITEAKKSTTSKRLTAGMNILFENIESKPPEPAENPTDEPTDEPTDKPADETIGEGEPQGEKSKNTEYIPLLILALLAMLPPLAYARERKLNS